MQRSTRFAPAVLALATLLTLAPTPARAANKEMVELLPLGAEDAVTVKALLGQHLERTGSPKAKAILANWDDVASRFVKVYPSEYRQAMEAASSPATHSLPITALAPSPMEPPVPVLVGAEEVK